MEDNVVSLFGDDLKACSYFDLEGDLGVSMRDQSISIIKLNKSQFEVHVFDESILFDRKELAEFLHVASILVDSEKKYLPDFDLIGIDY